MPYQSNVLLYMGHFHNDNEEDKTHLKLEVYSFKGENLRHDHYISKEKNLGSDDKIRYIWGLKGPIFIF